MENDTRTRSQRCSDSTYTNVRFAIPRPTKTKTVAKLALILRSLGQQLSYWRVYFYRNCHFGGGQAEDYNFPRPILPPLIT